MLNSFLYSALKAAFNDVLIENENVHADIERDYSTGYASTWRMTDNGEHGEQYRVNCPFCRNKNGSPDLNHHLSISYMSYVRPVIGGMELAVGPLYAQCMRANCLKDAGNRSTFEIMLHAGMACIGTGMDVSAPINMDADQDAVEEQTVSDVLTEEGIKTWVPDFHWCIDGMENSIYEYLQQRGVTPDMIQQFGLGWGQIKTPHTGRVLHAGHPAVIIPVVMNGNLKGVQARWPDKYIGDGDLRYWIHPGMRKRACVYNIDAARDLGVAVVCEGVFDVLKVGAPGVCCFGHALSPTQMLYLQTISDIIIWLPDTDKHADFDTVEEAYDRSESMNAGGTLSMGSYVVTLTGKDAGEMSRYAIWEEILKSVPADAANYLQDNIISRL